MAHRSGATSFEYNEGTWQIAEMKKPTLQGRLDQELRTFGLQPKRPITNQVPIKAPNPHVVKRDHFREWRSVAVEEF